MILKNQRDIFEVDSAVEDFLEIFQKKKKKMNIKTRK